MLSAMTWLNLYTALKPQEFGLEKKIITKKKWPQRPYATHGVANQVLYSLYLATLLQGAISLCTMGVWLSTLAALDFKALSLIWSAKTEAIFPFLHWRDLQKPVWLVWWRRQSQIKGTWGDTGFLQYCRSHLVCNLGGRKNYRVPSVQSLIKRLFALL